MEDDGIDELVESSIPTELVPSARKAPKRRRVLTPEGWVIPVDASLRLPETLRRD